MNKFDTIAPKAAALIRMLTSTAEGEVLNAVRLLLQLLVNAGLDIHALAERIEKGSDGNNGASRASLSAAEMQRIYDAAYQKGFADGSEHGRKSAIVAGPSIGTFNTGVSSGVNGYSWREIADHCAANKHLFYGRDYDFSRDSPSNLNSAAFRQRKQSGSRICSCVGSMGGSIELERSGLRASNAPRHLHA